MFQYDVIDIQHLLPRVLRVRLAPQNTSLAFLAGQYIRLHRAEHPDTWLPFSVASLPTDPYIELHIYEPRAESPNYWMWLQLNNRQTTVLSHPAGRCVYPPQIPETHHLVLIGVGVGLSPFLSVIQQHRQQPVVPHVSLFWNNDHTDEGYAHETLTQWAQESPHHFSYYPSLTQPNTARMPVGFIENIIPYDTWDPQHTQIYIAASLKTGIACWRRAQAHGFRQERCWADWFDFSEER